MSDFGTRGAPANTRLITKLSDTVSYRVAATGVSTSISAIFNEFVGAVDEYNNAIFSIKNDVITDPVRNDVITWTNPNSAASERWVITDVRGDAAGMYELRCMKPAEEA